MKNNDWGNWKWDDQSWDSSQKDDNSLAGSTWTQESVGQGSWDSSFSEWGNTGPDKGMQGWGTPAPVYNVSAKRKNGFRTAAILIVLLLLCSIIGGSFFLLRMHSARETADVKGTSFQSAGSDLPLPEKEQENASAAERQEEEEIPSESDAAVSETDQAEAGENQIAGADFYGSDRNGFYYLFLNEKERTAYAALSAACESLESTVEVDLDSAAQEKHVVDAFRYDHPEYYWLAGGVSYYYYDSGQIYQIQMDIPQDAGAILEKIYEVRDSVIARIPGGSSASDYEKIKWFYEYLIGEIEYGDGADDKGQTPKGALIDHLSVCAGYAASFKLLCDESGVECITLSGDALIPSESRQEPHAWNMVFLDGDAYWVDVTWADPLYADDSSIADDWIDYNYLCATDEDFLPEHLIDVTLGEGKDSSDPIRVEYPACTHEQYCYYNLQDLHFASMQEAEDYIRQCIVEGRDRICFKYDYKEDYQEGVEKLFEQNGFWNIVDEAGKNYTSMSYRKNDSYRTLMIELH